MCQICIKTDKKIKTKVRYENSTLKLVFKGCQTFAKNYIINKFFPQKEPFHWTVAYSYEKLESPKITHPIIQYTWYCKWLRNALTFSRIITRRNLSYVFSWIGWKCSNTGFPSIIVHFVQIKNLFLFVRFFTVLKIISNFWQTWLRKSRRKREKKRW